MTKLQTTCTSEMFDCCLSSIFCTKRWLPELPFPSECVIAMNSSKKKKESELVLAAKKSNLVLAAVLMVITWGEEKSFAPLSPDPPPATLAQQPMHVTSVSAVSSSYTSSSGTGRPFSLICSQRALLQYSSARIGLELIWHHPHKGV